MTKERLERGEPARGSAETDDDAFSLALRVSH
jgi:hypothetical protein